MIELGYKDCCMLRSKSTEEDFRMKRFWEILWKVIIAYFGLRIYKKEKKL